MKNWANQGGEINPEHLTPGVELMGDRAVRLGKGVVPVRSAGQYGDGEPATEFEIPMENGHVASLSFGQEQGRHNAHLAGYFGGTPGSLVGTSHPEHGDTFRHFDNADQPEVQEKIRTHLLNMSQFAPNPDSPFYRMK